MTILIIGKFDQDSFASHISQTFKAIGNSVFEYEIGIKYKKYKFKLLRDYESSKRVLYELIKDFERGRQYEVKRIIKSCQSNFDLIICTSDFFYPGQVTALKNYYKCKMVLWYPDHIINLKKSLFLTSDYDCLFFKEPYFVNVLRRE